MGGKHIVGPIIGMNGAVMTLIAGFFSIFALFLYPLNIYYILMVIGTFSIGIIGLIGAIVGIKGKNIAGGVLMLVAGIVPYILIYTLGIGLYLIGIPIYYPIIIAIDPILLIVGGILGLILRED